jgi:glycosyltransferase involved in cell wall biosynthesis
MGVDSSRASESAGRGARHARAAARYSVCMTNYNSVTTLDRSLSALFQQLDDQFEVVVVDNCSTDGSLQMLEKLSGEGRLRLVTRKCTRGVGRQLAFTESKGDYVISSVDLDDEIKPLLRDAVKVYHERFEGSLMLMQGFSIAPRKLLEDIGGWRDLQTGEDWDLWDRAASVKKFVFIPFDMSRLRLSHGSRGMRFILTQQYVKARDIFRLGGNPLRREGRRLPPYLLTIIVTPAAYVRSRFMKRFVPPLKDFRTKDYAVELDFEKLTSSV